MLGDGLRAGAKPGSGAFGLENLLVLVVSAAHADAVRELRLLAVGAQAEARRLEVVV